MITTELCKLSTDGDSCNICYEDTDDRLYVFIHDVDKYICEDCINALKKSLETA